MLSVANAYETLRSRLARKTPTPHSPSNPTRWRPYHTRKVSAAPRAANAVNSTSMSAREVTAVPQHPRAEGQHTAPRRLVPPFVDTRDPEGLIAQSTNLLASIYNPSMAARTRPQNQSTLFIAPPPENPSETDTLVIDPRMMEWFISELLRRSRASSPEIRAALVYITRAAPLIKHAIMHSDQSSAVSSPLLDPRRVYLAALILASKFLLDRTYTNKSWASVSGLDPLEVGRCERTLAEILEWRLWVGVGAPSN